MILDLTPQEAQFIFNNIGPLTVAINDANAAPSLALGQSILMKIKDATEQIEPVPQEEINASEG
tara:strand:- start:541 stop:732 length:192 start_codon:yes stop_codon:yes gene_type:complete